MKQTTFGASINVDEYLFREERISPIACSFACTAITDHHHVMHAALTYFRKEVSRQASRFQGQVFAMVADRQKSPTVLIHFSLQI